MESELLVTSPRVIALWFMVAYLYCWFACTNDTIWLATATALCYFFYRFTVSLSHTERITIPPISFLFMAWHCVALFFFAFPRRG